MTYQQVRDTMSTREKIANDWIMTHMQVNKEGVWKVNLYNKVLYRLAKLVLRGREPADRVVFYASLLDPILVDDMDDLKTEMAFIKKAFA